MNTLIDSKKLLDKKAQQLFQNRGNCGTICNETCYQKSSKNITLNGRTLKLSQIREFLGGLVGLRSSVVTAVAQIRFPIQELLHVIGSAKKPKNKQTNKQKKNTLAK